MTKTVSFFLWLRKRTLFRTIQRTFVMLMPLALIGSFFQLLRDAVFSPDSLIYNIANFDVNMTDRVWDLGVDISSGLVRVTFGIFGIYAAYLAARYTARLYHKDATMAGVAAVAMLLLAAYFASLNSGNRSILLSGILDIKGVLISLIVGYGVGQIFHFLAPDYHPHKIEHVAHIRKRAIAAIWPTIVTLIASLALGLAIYFLKIKMLNTASFGAMVSEIQSSNNLLIIIPLAILTSLLNWLGISYPSVALTNINNNGAVNANLNYALRHGNSWQVPYNHLGSSLMQSYGNVLALSFVILIVMLVASRQHYLRQLAKLNLLPATFNCGMGMIIGAPLLLNPIFLLPLTLLPVLNVSLAAAAISLHLLPFPAYPILNGVPAILMPFFSSNGSWVCLGFSVILLLIDIVLTLPFVKLNDRIEMIMEQEHEKA